MKSFSAIKIIQPLGEFYLTSLPVSLLLKVSFTTQLTLKQNNIFVGHQRRRDEKRIHEIANYLQSQDAVLPGTIILAANCNEDGEILYANGENEQDRWTVTEEQSISSPPSIVTINIPSEKKLAAVVDGQHRLWGFEELPEKLKDICLPCAVFLDLPTPQQAMVFATINFNQKPVSKSQSYELFGYNLDEEPEESWSPDKLAVFFARKLNVDEDSPFRNHIKVAAQDDRILADIIKADQKIWAISMATIVEGILSLITSSPKKDRDLLHRYPLEARSRKKILSSEKSNAPFRDFYLSENRDIVIYKTVQNYFNAVEGLFWNNIRPGSRTLIRKTAGIQALFRVLKELLPAQLETKDLSVEAWRSKLIVAKGKLNFEASIFTESSGKGKTRIQDAILVMIGEKKLSAVKDDALKKHLETVLQGGLHAE